MTMPAQLFHNYTKLICLFNSNKTDLNSFDFSYKILC